MEREYEYLKDFIREDGTKSRRYCSEEEADYVVLPINKYHGLKKAIKIVNDRSLNQIDKSKADEYGFRLMEADFRRYKSGSENALWYIKKETPYSIRIGLDEATMLIENKLRELYYWTDEFKVLRNKDIAKLREQWNDPTYQEKRFLNGNSDEGREIFKLWEEHPKMIVGIKKITVNYAQGVYQVGYWATEPV